MHKKSEILKQKLVTSADYTLESAFSSIDDWQYGYLDIKNIRSFFRNHRYLASNEELAAILRRFDEDGDGRISIQEFQDGIKAQEPYSRIVVKGREKSAQKIVNEMRRDKSKETIRVQALDRVSVSPSKSRILSTSPLKMRVKIDTDEPYLVQSPVSQKSARSN